MRFRLFVLFLLFATSASAQLAAGDFAIAEERIGIAPGNREFSRIASSRSGHLIAWTDSRLSESRIWAARLSRSGEILDPAGFVVARGPYISVLATDGEDYLLVTGATPTPEYHRVTSDGRVIHLPSQSFFPVAAVWTGDAYALFYWGSAGTVQVAMIDRDGRTLVTPRVVLESVQGFQSLRAVVGSGGRRVLLVWSELSDPELHHRLIDIAALRRGEAGSVPTVPRAAQRTSGLYDLQLASDGDGYLAVWYGDGGYRARPFDASGVPSGADIAHLKMGTMLVWDGSHYSNCFGSSLVRLTRSGVLAGTEPQAFGANTSVETMSVIDGQPLFVVREVVYPGSVLHVEINGVRSVLSRGYPQRDEVSVVWRGDHYLAAWHEQTFTSRVMVNRLAPNGRSLDGTGIALGSGSGVSLASDGRGAVVTWTADDGVHVAFVEHDGRWSERVFGNRSGTALAHWNGSQYLVAFNSVAMRISRGGTYVDAVPVSIATPGSLAAIGWTGSQYVVTGWTWVATTYGYNRILWAQVLAPALTPVGSKRALSYEGPYAKARIGESSAGAFVVFSTTQFELWASRFSPDGTLLDPEGAGFFVEYGKSAVSVIDTDADGWLVGAGGDVWSVPGPDRVPQRRKGYAFIPPKSEMTLASGGPAPLVVYRRPAVNDEATEPVRARFIVERRAAVRR